MNLEKMKSLNMLLLCGLYGSGKTQYALTYLKDASRHRISRTEIRKLIFEMTSFNQHWTSDKFNEEDDVLVKHVERKILEHFLHNKRNILIVNTFMTVQSRARFIKIAKDARRSIGAIFLDTPLEMCLENNQKFSTGVPAHVVNKLNFKKVLPTKSEGFDEVMIVTDFIP